MKLKSYAWTLTAFAALALTFSPEACAAFRCWDGNDIAADADDGDGTWDNGVTSNWDSASTGGAATNWNNAGNEIAVFSGTVGTVTISAGGVTAGGLQFDTSGYTLAPGGIIFARLKVLLTP